MKMTATASAGASALTGIAAAQSVGLAEYGTSWPVVIAALVGAAAALPGIKRKTRWAVAGAAVVAVGIGALGSPVVADWVGTRYGLTHAAVPPLLALVFAHFTDDFFRPLIGGLAARLLQKGAGK